MNRREYRKRLRDDAVALLSFERRLARLAMACYREWVPIARDAVLPALTADAFSAGLPPAPEQLMMTQAQWDEVLERTFLSGLEEAMAERVASYVPEEARPPLATGTAPAPLYGGTSLTPAAQSLYQIPSVRSLQETYLGEVRNRMVNTPSTIFREIAADLNVGIGKGEGYRDLAARVQRTLDVSLDDWPRRAETVARTEATGAFNGAAQTASEVRETFYGITLDKVWVSTMDSRTRKTHFAADGQRRPLAGTFRVGKSDLRFPGDPRGRAEEVINCRCTTIEVDPEDDLPDETDRQTERSETDATVRNRVGQRVGDIQGEVDRRRDEEGITRARDDDDGEGLIAAATPTEGDTVKRTWKGVLAPIGLPTGDSRIISPTAKIGFREFPQPLSWQKVSDDGHKSSVIVGGITTASVVGEEIVGEGFMLETPEAADAISLLEEGLIRPSIDPADVVWEMVDEDGNEVSFEDLEAAWINGDDIKVLDQFAELTVMGATLVDHPAFKEAKITLDPADAVDVPDDAEASLVASVTAMAATPRGYYVDRSDVFADPGFTEPTGLHMTDDGRIQGHLAIWGTCHVGSQPGDCRQPPQSLTNYALFHQHEVGTPDGPLAVGVLVTGGGHAGPKMTLAEASAHYDTTSKQWAFVRAGQDAHGIWVSGVAKPGVADDVLSAGLSAPLSGDWRMYAGNLEMIAALAVNAPGFPQPRGFRKDDGRDYSLVAAGAMLPKARPAGKGSGQSIAEIASRAAALAVEGYARRQQRQTAVAATASRIVARRRASVDALAARLNGRS